MSSNEELLKENIRINNDYEEFTKSSSPSTDGPEIRKFRASPSIAVVGSIVKLKWECDKSISGLEIRAQNGEIIDTSGKNKEGDSKDITIEDRNLPETTYELIAHRGEKETSKKITVRVFDHSHWVSAAEPWKDEGRIAGLIVNSDGDMLYAIVKEEGGVGSLWHSPDGFSKWEKININEDIPEDMTTSPAVFFNGKLVLLGGSKIIPKQVSNEIYMFDFERMKWVLKPETNPVWSQRMGHACIVFPDQKGDEKIWVLGGADENSNGLNDIWTWNGKDWKEEETNPPWAYRCMFEAATNGSELWIAGGFTDPEGKAITNIWKKDSEEDAWKQVMKSQNEPFSILDSGRLYASTIVSLYNQVYIIGYQDQGKTGNGPIVFYSIQERRGFYCSQELSTRPELPALRKPPSRIESVTFNGCIWQFTQGYLGNGRVENSGLYYWVPPKPPTVQTG
ncbi:MAG: kelch repeat-containing protein [bacterium]